MNKELADLAEQLQYAATVAHFMEANYFVTFDPQRDEADYTMTELDMERYLNSGGDFIDQNSGYYVDSSGGEVWNHVHDKMAWISDLIGRFGHADIEAIETLRQTVLQVPKLLCAGAWVVGSSSDEGSAVVERDYSQGGPPDEILLKSAITELSSWSGLAANTFATAFENSWEIRVANNYFLAEVLPIVLEAKIAAIQVIRQDIAALVETTIDSLKVVRETDDGVDDSVELAVLGSILPIALAITGVGGVAGAVIGAAFSLGSLAYSELKQKDDPVSVGGATVTQVLDSFKVAMEELEASFESAESKILAGFSGLYDVIIGPGADGRTVRENEFQVTFDSDSKMFDEATEDNVGDESMIGHRNSLEVDLDLLVSAASHFPIAAEPFATSAQILDDQSYETGPAFAREYSPSGASGITDGIYSDWCALRNLLQDILVTNGRMLDDTGQALLWIAESYGYTDDENGRGIQESIDNHEYFESGQTHGPESHQGEEYATV